MSGGGGGGVADGKEDAGDGRGRLDDDDNADAFLNTVTRGRVRA